MSSDFSTFVPNAVILESMIAMGIDAETAKIALYNTGNQSCNAAVAYVFDNPLADAEHEVLVNVAPKSKALHVGGVRAHKDSELGQPHKMVFVVNSSLEMGAGKIAAQVGHAALGCFRALHECDTVSADAIEGWEVEGERMVVLRGQNERHLQDLKESAGVAGLVTYLVQDAGLTEIAAGSVTVLGIFGQCEYVDTITGELNLL